MERAILAERLRDCGLNEKEASVFLELSLTGPGKASEVARRLNLTRMDAYNQLKKLADRGLLRATVERPMRFVALPIEDALDVLVKEREESITRIHGHRDFLKEAVKPPSEPAPAAVDATFRIHQDRRTIHTQIRKMITEAKGEILIAATKRSIARYASAGLLSDLAARKARPVQVRVLTQVDEENLDAVLTATTRGGYTLRHSDRVGSNLVIVDGKAILNSLVFDDTQGSKGREDVALWTDSADFVRAQKEFFEEAWEESAHLDERATELRTGRVVEPIKAYIGEGSMYERFKEILRQNPNGIAEVNAHLLKQGTTYGLRHFGIEPAHIFNLIGLRIGQEIAHDLSAVTEKDLGREIAALWNELGLGAFRRLDNDEKEARGIHDPGIAFEVKGCFSCRGMPTVGHGICAVDEGILQGIFETRLDRGARVKEAECTGMGHDRCTYLVRLLDPESALAAEAEKTARAHAVGR